MPYVILYRDLKTDKVYGEIGPEANGHRKFTTMYEATKHVEGMRESGIMLQIVELHEGM